MNPEQKQYLMEMARRRAGDITPEEVVAEAKKPKSPLHDLFVWNLKQAAERHWIERARELISCIKITVIPHENAEVRVVPVFVRDPRKPGDKQGYTMLSGMRDDKTLARLVVMDELGRVLGALNRALAVADALDATTGVADLIQQVETFKRDVVRRFPQPPMHS